MKTNHAAPRVLHIGKYFSPYSGGIESVTRDLMDAAWDAGWATHALVHHHERFKRGSETLPPHHIDRSPVIGQALFTPLAPLFWYDLHQALKSAPDLLHIHMPNLSAFWCLLNRTAKKRPWIVHWHSDVVVPGAPAAVSMAYHVYQPFERALLKRARHIIVTNPNVLEASTALQRWRAKCVVIPLTIPDTRAAASGASEAEPASPSRPLQLLTVGRLSVYKGHRFFLSVLADLKQRGIPFHWHVVGTGTEEKNIRTTIDELGLAASVTLHGRLSEPELARAYTQCDVFVLPSDSALEAFGVVLLEAMRAARPCVVQQVPGSGMSWVVTHQETGIVVPNKDRSAWVTTLADASTHRAKWRGYGRSGRRRYLRYFTPEAIRTTLDQLFKKIPKR